MALILLLLLQRSERYRGNTLYFVDAIRRIDLVLVYEDDLDFAKEQRRKTFFRNLVSEGLEVEIENPDPTKRVSVQSISISYESLLLRIFSISVWIPV